MILLPTSCWRRIFSKENWPERTAKEKKLKAAILGFGGMEHGHAAQYARLKNVELVALCDVAPEQLKKTEVSINLGDSGKTDLDSLLCLRVSTPFYLFEFDKMPDRC